MLFKTHSENIQEDNGFHIEKRIGTRFQLQQHQDNVGYLECLN